MAESPLHRDPLDTNEPLPPGVTGPAAAPLASPVVPSNADVAAGQTAPDAAPVATPRTAKRPRKYVSVLERLREREARGGMRAMMRDLPSFLFSLAVHMLVMVVLALWVLPEVPALVTADLMARPVDENQPELLEQVLELNPTDEIDEKEVEFEYTELQPDTELVEETVRLSPANEMESAPPQEMRIMDFANDAAPLAFQTAVGGFDGSGLSGRGHAARAALVRKGGGTAASESAVEQSLRWLAVHQRPDGTWSFDHRHSPACRGQCSQPGSMATATNGATAMALLPFLGAGQTHIEGPYQDVVARGVAALVRQIEVGRNGGSFIDAGNMYSHGLASIVLCEAYAMTGDPTLERPAQLALNFISYAQGPRGGWRYQPQTEGDTSVVGWQIMALKSGHMAYLRVPVLTVQGASAFLDYAAVDGGTGYSYAADGKFEYRASTSAIGLLCRMYLGWKRENEILARGVERIATTGPSENNYYYNYYATQLLFQFTDAQGPMWEKWNTAMRDQLVKTQSQDGHEKGSWFAEHGHNTATGGRLYCTSLASMTLEVYYRHMPIYQGEAVEMEFPE